MTGETQIMEMDKPISKTVVAIKRIDYVGDCSEIGKKRDTGRD